MRLLNLAGLLGAVVALSGPSHAAAASPPAAAASCIYLSPAGVQFTVTADGLSSVKFQGREIAHGGWGVFNAEGWFKDSGSNLVKATTVQQKSVSVTSPSEAVVRQVKDDLVTTSTYTFSGEDLLISTRIENNHLTAPINVMGFSGLQWIFGRPPEGHMQVQHYTYFQAHGVGLCHPSFWSPIGGSYATDDSFGVGTSPWHTGLMRTLTLWDYSSWEQDQREKSPRRNLMYFVVQPVPPRGAATFDFKLRVSPDRKWQHLLEPYREHFRSTFGEVRYKADNRWIATDYLNHSPGAIGPDNPYGFHGGFRRIDRPEGAAAFTDLMTKALKTANGQGVIVWGQGGEEPRGGMYRPDFDVLPPAVETNWPTIVNGLKAIGAKMGVATRPRDMAVRLDWKSDTIISINPDDPGHVAMLWARFDNMMRKGCTLFYLDSFGDSFEDVKLMRALREKLGPNILTFVEHQCDAMLPLSGGYSETSFAAAEGAKPAEYRLWSGMDNWEIYRWLAPGAQMASRLYQAPEKLPADIEPVDKFFFKNHVTPLIPSGDFSRAAAAGVLQGKYVKADGGWKAP